MSGVGRGAARAMGCCGSTVRVHEMKAPAESSDEEFDEKQQASDWSSATFKEEARSMFAMVDAGTWPPCRIKFHRPASAFPNPTLNPQRNSAFARSQTGVASSIAPSSGS